MINSLSYLDKYYVPIIVGSVIAVVLFALVILMIVFVVKNHKNKKKELNQHNQNVTNIKSNIVVLLGNKENILKVESSMSRLTVYIKNSNLINKDELNKLGLKDTIYMSDRVIFLVGSNSSELEEFIKNNI